MEVPIPYMFGLFFRPKFQGRSPENMVLTFAQKWRGRPESEPQNPW